MKTEILNHMKTEKLGKNVVYKACTGSTNQDALELGQKGAKEGTLVVADCQKAGKGRRGRSWVSPAGRNIYFTLLLKPSFAPDKAPMLTLVMALSVAQALKQETGIGVGIKWPNDLVLNGKKICGILTEMTLEQTQIQAVVIGVGINAGPMDFPKELTDKAASLETECGVKIQRASLIARIMECFEKNYDIYKQDENLAGLKEAYEACLVNRNQSVRVLDPAGEYDGIARGINENGELLIELADKTYRQVYAGEVSVRGIYGYV